MLNDNVALGSTVIVKLWDGSTLQGTVEAVECTLVSERLTVKFKDIRPWQVLAIVARDELQE